MGREQREEVGAATDLEPGDGDPAGDTYVEEAGSTGYALVMGLFIAASLVLIALGFLISNLSAVQQTAVFAASAVFGILARITQAEGHHAKTMSTLRRLERRQPSP